MSVKEHIPHQFRKYNLSFEKVRYYHSIFKGTSVEKTKMEENNGEEPLLQLLSEILLS